MLEIFYCLKQVFPLIIFTSPGEETFDEALKGVPVIIPGNLENKTSAMIKLKFIY